MGDVVSLSEYKEITYDKEKSLVVCTWSKAASHFEDEIYKQEMLSYLAVLQMNKPKHVIHNLQYFTFSIREDLQAWVNENINTQGYEAGVRLAYFVVSPSVFAQIPVEQIMEESESSLFEIDYFATMEDAMEKLLKVISK